MINNKITYHMKAKNIKIDVKSITTKFGTARLNNGYWRVSSCKEGYGGKNLHRLFYEEYHKCTLLDNAVIHHKDGNRLNNRIDNLELLSHANHIRTHRAGKPISDEIKKKISATNKGFYFREDIPLPDELLKEYGDNKTSYSFLARKYNCSVSTIIRRIKIAKGGI